MSVIQLNYYTDLRGLYLGDIIATSLKGRQTRIGFKGTNERYTIKLLHRSKGFTE